MFLLKDITVRFNEMPIMKDFNLSVHTSEKLLITAPSGSGKTTLLKLLLGFTSPQKGIVLFQDERISEKNIRNLRQQIGYLSQDIDFPNGKVSKVLDEIFNYPANKKLKLNLSSTQGQMEELRLNKEILDKNINQLSGGERQRLGWLVLRLLDRPVLLLDEPTSALDKELKQKLIRFAADSSKQPRPEDVALIFRFP